MGILSKVGNLIGSGLNYVTGVNSSMEAQNAYNTEMWNAQNAYNTPSAQLARMREAGIDINPTSYALGTGNLSNVASHVSSGSGSPAGNPISMALGVAGGLAEIKNKKAYTDNINAQTENLNNFLHGTGRSTYDPTITKVIEDAPKNIVKGTKKVFDSYDKATGFTDRLSNLIGWFHSGSRALRQQQFEEAMKKIKKSG